jgi:tetratricopeptide (TPR) repeat protein
MRSRKSERLCARSCLMSCGLMRDMTLKNIMAVSLLLLGLVGTSLADSTEKVFARCGQAVVVIKDGDGDLIGSGVLVADDGVVLTAAHLFDGEDKFSVHLIKGGALPFKRFLFRDDDLDLAALDVSGRDLPHVSLGQPDAVRIGQDVLTIGNPMGLENSVSVGIISGKRALDADKYLFQTTAPISQGSSGGGLFDDQGRLLAITISYLEEGQNLNFCVPVTYADIDSIPKLDKMIEKEPAKVDHYRNRAKAYYAAQERELALVDLRTALQLAPSDYEVNELQGEIYYEQGRHDEAVEVFTKTIALQPKNAEGYFDRGYTFAEQEKYESAIVDLEKAVELDPTHEAAVYGLARCLFILDKNLEAAEVFGRAIELDPKDARYYEGRGAAFFDAGEYEKAKSDLTKCLEIDESHIEARLRLARVCLVAGESEKALAYCNAAIELEGELGEAHFFRALSHIGLSSYESALADLDRAVELEYHDPRVFFWRGSVFDEFGRYDRAIKEFSRSLELDPAQPDTMLARGVAHLRNEEKVAAEKDFRAVLSMEAEDDIRKEAEQHLAELGR